MAVMIREAEWEEIEAIADLAKKIWTEHYTSIIGVNQVKYMLRKFQSASVIEEDIKERGYIYFIAIDKDHLIGYCAIKYEDKELFLSKIYIEKESRGQGIAKCFLDKSIEKAQNKGLSSIYLTVNKNNHPSIAAYQKMGFTITEEVVSDIGGGFVMDDYIMRRNLK